MIDLDDAIEMARDAAKEAFGCGAVLGVVATLKILWLLGRL